MSNWLVGEGVLGQEMSDHVSFDFDGVPIFSTVAVNNRSAHLWHDDGISEMSFDTLWFFTENGVLLLEVQFLLESIVLSMNTVFESSVLSGFHQTDNFGSAHIEELVKLDSSIDLLSEWLFFHNLL